MIRSARSRHRFIFLFIAPLVLLLLVYSLINRGQTAERLSVENMNIDEFNGELQWSRGDLWESVAAEVRLYQAHADSGRHVLRIQTTKPISAPDVLVYLSEVHETPIDMLPRDALLLGPVRDSRPEVLSIPFGFSGKRGRLILYSLAWQKVLDRSKPATF